MPSRLHTLIESIIGSAPLAIEPLTGGCVAEVYKIRFSDCQPLVAKVDHNGQSKLDREGMMLRYLANHSRLPVPVVHHCSDTLLLMDFVEGSSYFPRQAQHHAAELLAELHNISAHGFGFDDDTLVGGLHQPNPWSSSWLDFFRDQRLLYMGNEALRARRMPQELWARLQKFVEKLDNWLEEPEHPSLIHGDVWSTNVLTHKGYITGFIDPAIYYADAEIELAFTTLFGTFSAPFFERYNELRPIRSGFTELRRDIYNLYPLLVHVRLFGGHYAHSVDRTLARLGY